MSTASLYIVMGVSGSGKTTVARALATANQGLFLDADDFHSAANKARMHAGIPLTDADRRPWLDRLNQKLRTAARGTEPVFLACSALKEIHRDQLVAGLPEARFVYLKGSPELIGLRLAHRTHHFMPASLLQSQFAELEEPRDAIVLDVSRTTAELVADFARAVSES